jgi:hypothetical protein
MIGGNPDAMNHSLELIGALVILAGTAHFFGKRHPESKPFMIIPHAYQWLAAGLMLLWVFVHVSQPFQFIVLAALFAGSFVAAISGIRYAFGPGVALAAAGWMIWLAGPRGNGAELQNFLAIGILAATQVLARRKPGALPLRDAMHQLWIAMVSASVWIFLSWWVIAHSVGAHFYLTASWAILAFILFGIGFALRERTYRWAALGVLACALTRVVMLDVWRLETIYRILSFLALGIVLLVLGYFYTRFQEKIAKWL